REERIGRGYVLYINEVASLTAVSKNRNRLVLDRFFNKSRNDRAVFISWILIGTKNVKITKGNGGESPFIREGATVPFAFSFACGIRIFRIGRHTFDLWIGRIVSVDCSRAAEDQFFHTCPRRFFQNN